MLAFRNAVRIAGTVIFLAGFSCLPIGSGVSPKRDTSAFYRAADTGSLLHVALALLAAGLLLFIVSVIMPPHDE